MHMNREIEWFRNGPYSIVPIREKRKLIFIRRYCMTVMFTEWIEKLVEKKKILMFENVMFRKKKSV